MFFFLYMYNVCNSNILFIAIKKTLTNNDLDDDEGAKHTKSHIKNNNFINANKSISEIRN